MAESKPAEKRKRCPACRKLSPANGKFCLHCGSSLNATDGSTSKSSEVVDDGVLREPCPSCGEMTSVDEKFCEHCDSFLGKNWAGKSSPAYRGASSGGYRPSSTPYVAPTKTCKACGATIKKTALRCPQCLNNPDTMPVPVGTYSSSSTPAYAEDKTSTGVWMCLLLGWIGLIIGLCSYRDYERKTFLSGWLKAFIISLIVVLVVGTIIFAALGGNVKDLFDFDYYWIIY